MSALMARRMFMAASLVHVSNITAQRPDSMLDKQMNCLTTEWSRWSEPFGFGTVSRERRILRYPTKGGRRCPKQLTQSKNTGRRPSVDRTAELMADNFVKPRPGKKIGQLRDLLIVLDSSGSVGSKNFRATKRQLARLVGMLCPTPDPFKGYQRAGLLVYSNKVKKIFDLKDKRNTAEVQEAIRRMRYLGKATCTGDALRYARDKMFRSEKGMRRHKDVKQEVLILSDGRSNCGGRAVAAARSLQQKADVYGLMIGEHSDQGKTELSNFVSRPLKEHLFTIRRFQDFKTLVDHIDKKLENVKCAPFELGNQMRDDQGFGNQNLQNQRLDNQRFQNQRPGNQRFGNQRSGNQRLGNQRSGNQRSQNQRSQNQRSQNQRSQNQRSQNQRSQNQRSQNQRSQNQKVVNNRPENQNFRNQRLGNQGFEDQGIGDQRVGNQGFEDQGIGDQRVGNQRIGNQRIGNQRSNNQRTGNQNSRNQRLGNQGFEDQGFSSQGLRDQRVGNQRSNNQRAGNQNFRNQRHGNQGIGNQMSQNQNFRNRGLSDQGRDDQKLGNQRFQNQRFDNQRLGNQNLETQTLGNQMLGTQTLGNQMLETQTLGHQRLGEQMPGNQ